MRRVLQLLLLEALLAGAASPALSASSPHWVYALPQQQQTNRITVTVHTRRHDASPSPRAEVIAYCQPWDFVHRGATDAAGRLAITGPPGDWTVYGRLDSPGGALVIARSLTNTVTRNTSIVLDAMPQRELRFTTTGGVDLLDRLRKSGLERIHEACRPHLWFAPEGLPAPVGQFGCGASDPATPYSLLLDGRSTGLVQLASSPTPQQAGYALTMPVPPAPANRLTFDESELAALQIGIESLPPGTQVHLSLQLLNQPVNPMKIYVPVGATASTYTMRITPGDYRVILDTSHGPFAARLVHLPQSGAATLRFGGPFRARVGMFRWNASYFSAWADVEDKYGQAIQHPVGGKGHFTLRNNGRVIYQSEITRCYGRCIEIIRPWGADWQSQNCDYDYRIDSPLTGPLECRGTIRPGHTLFTEAKPIFSSERFTICAREAWADGATVGSAMEKAYQWMADHFAGQVSSSSAKPLIIYYLSPTDVAWSSGKTVGVDIYSSYFFDVRSDAGLWALLHEVGHSYAWPPNGLPALGTVTGESVANLLMWNALRGTLGERRFRVWRQQLNSRLGGAGAAQPDLSFVLDYLEQKLGTELTRDYYRALHKGKGNCREIVLSLAFLKTEAEKTSAILSFLAKENVAWLYRWAGFDVSNDLIERALTEMKKRGAVGP